MNFNDLPTECRENSVQRTFRRNETIYNIGDAPENLYIIQKGVVGLFHVNENGHETFLRVFSDGDLFGHRSILAKENYHATAMSLTKTELVVMSKVECEKLCLDHPSFLWQVASIMAKELKHAEYRLCDMQDKSAPRRIAESIVFLKLRNPDYTWTNREIAEFSGSTPESVSRLMTTLVNENLITREGRNFNIIDLDRFLEYSHSLS